MSLGGTLLVFLLAVGLLAGKISHDYEEHYGPKVRAAERYAEKLRICQKFGAKCELYACYRTDKGKFICNP